jgi:tRNA(Ile)-lysidine synthase
MSKKDLSVLKKKNFLNFTNQNLEIYNRFKKYLEKKIQSKPFVVAVSGGPDSMALTSLSYLYSKEKRSKVQFIHIDHGIRKNSYKESILVKNTLKKKKINLKILVNKKIIDKNIQKNARDIRYDLLNKFCQKYKINFILTGHHSDDQIETFLIRLSRGSGVQGLSSMSKETKLKNRQLLIRPLLDIKKNKLINIAKNSFGTFIKDSSNTNEKYLRTKIRKLKKLFEKNGISHNQIIRSINNLASTKKTLNLITAKFFKENVDIKKNKATIRVNFFLQEAEELRLKILSNILKKISKTYYQPRSIKVLNLLEKIRKQDKFKSTLGGCIIEKLGGILHIYKEKVKRVKY